LLVAWLHLAVLWSFAIAKPLFDVLADEPAFFVARGNTRADILIFAFALVLVPPTLLVAVELVFSRARAVRRAVHLLFIAGLVSAFALQVLVDIVSWKSGVLIPVAVALGLLAALAYARLEAVRSILTVLSPAPAVFLVLFLLVSPVSKLILPQDEEGAAAANVTTEIPVVMIVFDEFSGVSLLDEQGRVDARRFPNLAALARGSTWYPNATTVADVTTEAVPAMLSSEKASRDKLPTASDYPNNLFSLLGDSYKLDVHESATRLCSERLCGSRTESSVSGRLRSLVEDLSIVSMHQLAPDDLDPKIPAVDRTFAGFRGGGAADQPAGSAGIPNQAFVNRKRTFDQFVSDLRPEQGRHLHFFHTQLPHIPHIYLPSEQQYPVNGPDVPGLDGEVWEDKPSLVKQAEQRYLLQAAFVDRLMGNVMRRLKTTGMWDKSLVVVTADHGVSFLPGTNRRYVTNQNFADIASVPLFVKAPNQRGGRINEAAARTSDIVPTIAEKLGIRIPWTTVGKPLDEVQSDSRTPLTVTAFAGGAVTLPFDRFKELRAGAADRLAGLLNGKTSLYEVGPRGDLVGQQVTAFAAAARLRAQVELDAPNLYAAVEPNGRIVPSMVTGSITGDVSDGQVLAIAINGRIQSSIQVFESEGEKRFAAMVPPAAFRAGRNSIQVLAVTGAGSSTRLAALGVGGSARLVKRDGRESVVIPGKKEVTITSEDVTGFVDRVTYEGDQLSVLGWAVDAQAKRAPDRILIFTSDGLLVAGAPSILRPDIEKQYGKDARTAGFQLRTVAANAEDLADPAKLRVIAVSGDRAGELHPSDGIYVGRGP
jgi:hypothetical protein